MKIALLGYGKMGKVIEKIALERGHEIVLRKSSAANFDGLLKADIAIDFSVPTSAVNHISECLNQNIPVISGTTGWLENYDEMVQLCQAKNGSFIYASNFSLGVNIFFELNNYLAKMMKNLKDYNVSMEEIHHTQKIDAPSGTAVTIAEGILEENKNYTHWELTHDPSQVEEQNLAVIAKREDSVPGTHLVKYTSDIDTISFEHVAHNRDGFALGAVIAAEWLGNKKGLFTMHDVLKINL